MNKANIVLCSVGGAVAVVVLAGAVLAATGFSKAAKERERAEKAGRDLSGLYKRSTFPSEENVEAAKADATRLAGWTRDLSKALDSGAFPVARSVSPGAFLRMRQEMIDRLQEGAPPGISPESPSVSPGFGFGFDRYADGKPPEPAHVSRLVRQLRETEALVGVLYSAGFLHLDAVGREEFEDASPEEGGEGGSRHSSRRLTGSASGTTIRVPLAPSLADARVPVVRDRFAFQFLTREASLVAALDAIDALRPFAMVSALSIEKVGPDVIFPDEAEAIRGERQGREEGGGRRPRRHRRGGEAEAEAAPAPAALNEHPAPRSSRLVSGPLREAPVRVTLFVDVCSVPSASKAAAADAAAGEEED